MLEEDRVALCRMKADFEALASMAENDFKNHANYARVMNHYTTVYMAATRNALNVSEYAGYDAGELLYIDYQEMLTRYLIKYKDLTAPSKSELFNRILKIWGHYKVLMKWNMRAFAYLSRYYIVNHSKPSLYQAALTIFLEQVFKQHAKKMSQVAFSLLAKERAGETGCETQIATAIELFSAMSIEGTQSIYHDTFLAPYLAKTQHDYEERLLAWSVEGDGGDLLRRIHEALQDEKRRCNRYFPLEDHGAIMKCVESVFIDSPLVRHRLLESTDGFCKALHDRDEHLLTQYYALFSRSPSGLAQIAALIRRQIEVEGSALSETYAADEASVDVIRYVSAMMQLQEVFPRLLAHCFQMEFTLSKAVREGLEKAFSCGVKVTNRLMNQSRVAPFSEWLAHYADMVLQQSTDSVTIEIDRIVTTLAYVTDRDRFLANTREQMAERMLFPAKKFNEANERMLVQRIRQRCGASSTAYLEGMLHDLDTSNAFHAMNVLRTAGQVPPFTVTLLVAKRGIWPARLSVESEWRLPESVQHVLDRLRDAYLEGTSARVLTWSHESSSADVEARFNDETQILSVSAVQALALLAFNTHERLTLKEMNTMYSIPLDVLMRGLPPLLKSRLLVRPSANAALTEDDVMEVNARYACKGRRRLRLPPTLVRVSVADGGYVAKQVDEDRKPAIDASLVRIMKSRRTMEHKDLVDECAKQLSQYFTPDIKCVKQRIEELIARDFLERDPKKPSTYRYVA